MKKRANYNLLKKKLILNQNFEMTREQLSKEVNGYISSDPKYLKKRVHHYIEKP